MSKQELYINYLCDAATTLKRNDPIHNLIRSNLLTNCFVKSESNFKLLPKSFGLNSHCGSCSTPWSQNNYKSKLLPKKHLTKNMRRKYRSIIKNKDGRQSIDKIKRAEEKLHSKTLLIKCLFCNKMSNVRIFNKVHRQKDSVRTVSRNLTPATHIPYQMLAKNSYNKIKMITSENQFANKAVKRKLQNLIYQTANSKQPTPVLTSSERSTSTAKRKKQRDKFAGLSKVACIASTPPSISNNPLRLMLKPRKVLHEDIH